MAPDSEIDTDSIRNHMCHRQSGDSESQPEKTARFAGGVIAAQERRKDPPKEARKKAQKKGKGGEQGESSTSTSTSISQPH